jgi:hypothetical protein
MRDHVLSFPTISPVSCNDGPEKSHRNRKATWRVALFRNSVEFFVRGAALLLRSPSSVVRRPYTRTRIRTSLLCLYSMAGEFYGRLRCVSDFGFKKVLSSGFCFLVDGTPSQDTQSSKTARNQRLRRFASMPSAYAVGKQRQLRLEHE